MKLMRKLRTVGAHAAYNWCTCCVVLMRMLGGIDAHAAWC